MTTHGIDLSQSGWDNPDGFVKRPRPSTPAPPVPDACGAAGPDGWTCDLPPVHLPLGAHYADDGSPHGLRWTTEMADASTFGTPPDQPRLIPGRIITSIATPAEIHALAAEALKAESPAAWVLALDKIRGMTKP